MLTINPTHLQNPVVGLFNAVSNMFFSANEKPCYPFLRNLAAGGRPVRELVANVMGLAVGSSVNYAQGMHSFALIQRHSLMPVGQ